MDYPDEHEDDIEPEVQEGAEIESQEYPILDDDDVEGRDDDRIPEEHSEDDADDSEI